MNTSLDHLRPALLMGVVFAACCLGACVSLADEPAPPPAIRGPVVIQQIQGDANGFQLQVQVGGAVVPPPPQQAPPALDAEVGEGDVLVAEAVDVDFGFPGLVIPFNGPAGGPQAPAGIVDAVGDLVRAAFGAAAPPVPAEAADPAEQAEQAANPAQAAAIQRQAQIAQHAKQLEQLLQPVLRSELELIRATCGDLRPPVRRAILVTGRDAVAKAALAFAKRQMNGDQARTRFDPQAMIREAVAAAVEKEAGAETCAAYGSERKRRDQRRAEAARVRIVSRLDSQLDLTAEQRAAIERDLEARWQPGWLAALADQGMVVNGRPLAPDFCDGCVRAHLGAAQRQQWDAWRKAAGTAVVGWGWASGMALDGQGLQQADEWWGQ